MKTEKVLVTGGNGHVGNTLVKALCDKGYSVRTTVRDIESVKSYGIYAGYDVELFQADIRDQKAIEKAVQGVGGVFHVAALYAFRTGAAGEDMVSNNVEGSLAVLKAAKACGVRRVVMTSSIVAVGFGGEEGRAMTEDNWNSPGDAYCRSKLESEKAAWAYSREYRLDLVTLCPGLVLGPGFYRHTASTRNVGACVNNRMPFRFPMPASVVDVREVADAHVLAYEKPEAAGRYLASGSHLPDLWETLKQCDPCVELPDRMLSVDELKQFSEKSGASAELLGRSFLYSDRKIREELGWIPRPVEETIIDTIKWIKERRM